jgi:hypothetical protein
VAHPSHLQKLNALVDDARRWYGKMSTLIRTVGIVASIAASTGDAPDD